MKTSYFISGMNMNQILKTFLIILLAFGFLTGCDKSDQGSKSNSLVKNTGPSAPRYSLESSINSFIGISCCNVNKYYGQSYTV